MSSLVREHAIRSHPEWVSMFPLTPATSNVAVHCCPVPEFLGTWAQQDCLCHRLHRRNRKFSSASCVSHSKRRGGQGRSTESLQLAQTRFRFTNRPPRSIGKEGEGGDDEQKKSAEFFARLACSLLQVIIQNKEICQKTH